MADKILQELGFDVSDALTNLSAYEAKVNSVIQTNSRFQKSFARFNQTNTSLNNLPKSADRTIRSLADIANNAQRAGNQVAASGDRFQQGSQQLEKFGRTSQQSGQQLAKLTIDFETFARIISTQVIVRALNRIELALTESFRSAIEFGTGLAEIETIARGSLGDFDQLGDSIVKLANAFNTDIQAVREGVYQTLSNQVVEAAESFEFLETALELSTATITDSDQAVNALASVMNAFSLEADRADQVASALFKTVELGRLRLDDIADTLGRVTATGAQLGVTFEEILASISTLTVQGVRPAEAFTQLSGIFNALLKPSERLREVLQTLGFDSGQAALETLGLAGTLQTLSERVGGSADEVAQLFPNVRGLRGQFILTAEGAQRLNQNLAEFQRLTGDEAREAAGLVLATDAQEAELALQQFQNFFTTEFGPALIDTFNEVTESLGGADAIIETLKDFAPTLKFAIPALFLFGSRMAFVRAQATGATAAITAQTAALQANAAAAGSAAAAAGRIPSQIATGLSQLGLATVLVGVGESVGNSIGRSIADRLTSELAEIDSETRRQFDEFKQRAQERLALTERFTEERKRSALQAVREIGQAHQSEIQTLQTNIQASVEGFNSLVNRTLQFNENLVEGFQQLEERSRQEVLDSQERQLDIQDRLETRQFRRRLGLIDEERQAVSLLSEARRRISEAQRSLPQTQDEQSLSRTLDLFEKGIQLADEAARSGTPQERRVAEFAIEEALRRQLQVEERLQKVRTDRANEAKRQADDEAQNLERLRVLAKTITQATSPLDSQGQLLSATELEEQRRRRQQAVQEFLEQTLSSDSIDQASLIGILDLSETLSRQDIELGFSFAESSVQRETSRLEQLFANLTVNFPELRAITGEAEIRSFEDINRTIKERQEQINDGQAQLTEIEKNVKAAELLREQIAEVIDRIEAPKVLGVDLLDQGASETFDFAKDTFESLNEAERVSLDQLAAVERAFAALEDRLSSVSLSIVNAADPEAFGRIQTLVAKFQELQSVEEKITSAEQPADQLRQNITDSGRELDLLSISAATFAAEMERAAAASERLRNLDSATVPTRAFGGRFFAAGGLNRGLDTQLAMLTPGEFVVNRDASQKFFSDLQRINAGLTPQFRNTGGDVAQVGDVNISVHESTSPRETAREVMSQINRQLRRRSAKLN